MTRSELVEFWLPRIAGVIGIVCAVVGLAYLITIQEGDKRCQKAYRVLESSEICKGDVECANTREDYNEVLTQQRFIDRRCEDYTE